MLARSPLLRCSIVHPQQYRAPNRPKQADTNQDGVMSPPKYPFFVLRPTPVGIHVSRDTTPDDHDGEFERSQLVRSNRLTGWPLSCFNASRQAPRPATRRHVGTAGQGCGANLLSHQVLSETVSHEVKPKVPQGVQRRLSPKALRCLDGQGATRIAVGCSVFQQFLRNIQGQKGLHWQHSHVLRSTHPEDTIQSHAKKAAGKHDTNNCKVDHVDKGPQVDADWPASK